jgi:tRNA(His) 5'-end guanylyltransferase
MKTEFSSLEDKCLYYRGTTDYKLNRKQYVIIMLDGRSFSKLIKKKYERPFSDKFIGFMNETAKYLCENVSNCKMAYVQSDEISLVLSDLDSPETDVFFGYRLCKLQSIIASMATAKFNHLVTMDMLDALCSSSDMKELIEKQRLVEFDCKAWNVPTENDMYAWFLFRQNDCIKNSKQQAAQTYLPHKQLLGKNTDEQVSMLENANGIKWDEYDDGKKYGRFIYRETVVRYNEKSEPYTRHIWTVHNAFILNKTENRDKFIDIVTRKND